MVEAVAGSTIPDISEGMSIEVNGRVLTVVGDVCDLVAPDGKVVAELTREIGIPEYVISGDTPDAPEIHVILADVGGKAGLTLGDGQGEWSVNPKSPIGR